MVERRAGHIDPSDLDQSVLNSLRGVAARVVGAIDADDALQDGLSKVIENKDRYEECSFGLYMTTVVRSALDILRAKGRRGQREVSSSFQAGPRDKQTEPFEDRVITELELDRVLKTFDKLSPKYREVLGLHHIGGFSYEQIAVQLGIPVNTVKSRMLRGKESLMKHLNFEENGADIYSIK